MQAAMRTEVVVPVLVIILPPLNAFLRKAGQNILPVNPEGFKCAFQFAIQVRRSDAATHMLDLQTYQGLMKTAAELRAVVSDDKTWLAMFFNLSPNQQGIISRRLTLGDDLNEVW